MENHLNEGNLSILEEEALIELRLSCKNKRLVASRKAMGLNAELFAEKIGIARTRLRDIENLRLVPSNEEIARISIFLNKPTDYLFPEYLLKAIEMGMFKRREAQLTKPHIVALTEAKKLAYDGEKTMIDEIYNESLKLQINRTLRSLPSRERKILEMRIGLNDDEEMTLEEVGKRFDRGKERIRQLEARALRKLRNPKRSRSLRRFWLESE